MYRRISVLILAIFWTVGLNAQIASIDHVLKEIENNNKELKAKALLLESKREEVKSGNNFQDPDLVGFYLPFGEHFGPDYYEFQISQTFDFPSVYGARGNLIDKKLERLEEEYKMDRQAVLLKAKHLCQEIIYLNKRMEVEERRMDQARKQFAYQDSAYKAEQTGVLELNKAKVSLLQQEFKLRKVENQKFIVQGQLNVLNGGKELNFDATEYTGILELIDLELLWQEKLENDPEFILLSKAEALARQQLSLSKNMSLPKLTAGYNYQGIEGSNYHGIYAGLSIPLWSNNHLIKSARLNLKYNEEFRDSKTAREYNQFKSSYDQYNLELSRYRDYQSTLFALNTEEMKQQIYRSGEMTYVMYYLELQFYRDAQDEMMEMELFLHQKQAELLKHQL